MGIIAVVSFVAPWVCIALAAEPWKLTTCCGCPRNFRSDSKVANMELADHCQIEDNLTWLEVD